MGKYFTVEVKPTIPTVASGQHAEFADDELLFDWYAFDVPKGTCRLLHIDQEVRPKGDSGSTVNEFDLDLLLAKANQDGTAPSSIGTVNSAALGSAVNLSNNMMGFIVRHIFIIIIVLISIFLIYVHLYLIDIKIIM